MVSEVKLMIDILRNSQQQDTHIHTTTKRGDGCDKMGEEEEEEWEAGWSYQHHDSERWDKHGEMVYGWCMDRCMEWMRLKMLNVLMMILPLSRRSKYSAASSSAEILLFKLMLFLFLSFLFLLAELNFLGPLNDSFLFVCVSCLLLLLPPLLRDQNWLRELLLLWLLPVCMFCYQGVSEWLRGRLTRSKTSQFSVSIQLLLQLSIWIDSFWSWIPYLIFCLWVRETRIESYHKLLLVRMKERERDFNWLSKFMILVLLR